jgi:hypothetical protein
VLNNRSPAFINTFLHQPVVSSPAITSKTLTFTTPQKPSTVPAQNHESALTDKLLNPECTERLSAIVAAQLGSDFKTYAAAAAQHALRSRCGQRGTKALGRLGVIATYGASTLFLIVAEWRKSLTPDSVELGGIYEPATPTAPIQLTIRSRRLLAVHQHKRTRCGRVHARPYAALLKCYPTRRSPLRMRKQQRAAHECMDCLRQLLCSTRSDARCTCSSV